MPEFQMGRWYEDFEVGEVSCPVAWRPSPGARGPDA